MIGSDSIIDKMQAFIDRWEPGGDRRAIFLSCYAMMTRNMLVAVHEDQFEDGPWVSNLLQRFADYYFVALDAYERDPFSAPQVWQVAFSANQSPKTHVLQHLILGVNAHINYDLVFTLSDLLAPEWAHLSPEQRRIRYRDHCHVNEIIYQTIDAVQDQVIERHTPDMDLVDKFMGRLDEWITSRLISSWREQVWESATRFVQAGDDTSRAAMQQEIEQRSLGRARSILGGKAISE